MVGMSNSSRGPAQLSIAPEMPRGEVVGRYRTYAQAQKAVDHMADENFPVAMVSIIGSDLKSVEQVTGRLSYPRVALQGALNGVVFGAFFGLLMSLLGGANMAASLGLTMVLGGAFWMLMATITYAMSRGKRDFTSTSRIVAGSYEVLAAPEVAGQARQVLSAMGRGQAAGQNGQGQPPAGFGGQAPQGGQWGGPQQGGPRNGGFQGGPGQGAPQQRPPYGGPAQNGQYGTNGQGAPSQPYSPEPYNPQSQDPRTQSSSAGGTGYAGDAARPDGSTAAGQSAQESANRSAKFPDLPDGRPQYGIRIDPEANGTPTAPAARPESDQGQPAQAQPEQTAPWNRPSGDDAAQRPDDTARLPEDRRDS